MALPDFISETAAVRRLARNVLVADFDDPQIVKEQKAAFSKIGTKTGKFDWALPDPRFYDIQKLEEQQAASYVLQHYGSGTAEEMNMITYWDSQVKDGLQEIVDEGTDPESDKDVLIATSNYESYPASLQDNPNAIPFRSTAEYL
jgi:hypothetical protein